MLLTLERKTKHVVFDEINSNVVISSYDTNYNYNYTQLWKNDS